MYNVIISKAKKAEKKLLNNYIWRGASLKQIILN
jgi:hypothetical protein